MLILSQELNKLSTEDAKVLLDLAEKTSRIIAGLIKKL